MEDLINALLIFLKYGNPVSPTHCEHYVMLVNVNPDIVSQDDKNKLKELGFEPSNYEFQSFRFGKKSPII